MHYHTLDQKGKAVQDRMVELGLGPGMNPGAAALLDRVAEGGESGAAALHEAKLWRQAKSAEGGTNTTAKSLRMAVQELIPHLKQLLKAKSAAKALRNVLAALTAKDACGGLVELEPKHEAQQVVCCLAMPLTGTLASYGTITGWGRGKGLNAAKEAATADLLAKFSNQIKVHAPAAASTTVDLGSTGLSTRTKFLLAPSNAEQEGEAEEAGLKDLSKADSPAGTAAGAAASKNRQGSNLPAASFCAVSCVAAHVADAAVVQLQLLALGGLSGWVRCGCCSSSKIAAGQAAMQGGTVDRVPEQVVCDRGAHDWSAAGQRLLVVSEGAMGLAHTSQSLFGLAKG